MAALTGRAQCIHIDTALTGKGGRWLRIRDDESGETITNIRSMTLKITERSVCELDITYYKVGAAGKLGDKQTITVRDLEIDIVACVNGK